MSGFDAFRAALPDPLLRIVDPAGAVADDAVRQAIALAIAGFLLAFLVRIGLRIGSAVWFRLHRQALPRSISRPLVLARRITGVAAVALPWCALLWLHTTGSLGDGWFRASALCGWLWLLLRAADHHRLVLDVGRDVVVVRHGLAIGPLDTATWPVAALLIQADGTPLPPVGARRKSMEVLPRQVGWQALVHILGGERPAQAWLQDAVRKLSLAPARTWRVYAD